MAISSFLLTKPVIIAVSGVCLALLGLVSVYTVPSVIRDIVYSVSTLSLNDSSSLT